MRPRTIKELFAAAGNATQLAASLNLCALTVENWRKRGIPQKHWAAICEKYGVKPEDLYRISVAAQQSASIKLK